MRKKYLSLKRDPVWDACTRSDDHAYAAMPYRSMTNIINFIKAVDQVVPGFASYETLLYSPELKFYSNRVKMDADLNTNIRRLHCLGDSFGWTRGLMMASVMGVLMGREILRQENI